LGKLGIKTNQKELDFLQAHIERNKQALKEIHESDRQLYKQTHPIIINWTASMKPLISTLAIIGYIALIFLMKNQTDNDLLQKLFDFNIIQTLESIIGFWFGFGSMETIKYKNKIEVVNKDKTTGK
jgi:hypothetical protein